MDELTAQATFGVAFAAGVISFLSPCILPVMPAYLTLISGLTFEELQEQGSAGGGVRRRVLTTSAAFVAGFSVVFIVLGASATLLGRALRGYELILFGVPFGIAQLAGIVVILMGLHIAGWLPIHALYRVKQLDVRPKSVGIGSAFAVGAAFAFGWSPCIGPILGTILTLSGAQETVAKGVLLLMVYSAGLALPFFLCGWSVEFLMRIMGGMRNHFAIMEKSAGVVLIVIGALMLTNQLMLLNAFSNDFFAGMADWVLEAEESLLD
jgi:cytochrome c-type biogenesis protein